MRQNKCKQTNAGRRRFDQKQKLLLSTVVGILGELKNRCISAEKSTRMEKHNEQN
jgi:hypothetical protein